MSKSTLSNSTGVDPVGVSIPEAVRIGGIGRGELYEAINAKKIDARKAGSRTIIILESLRSYVRTLPAYDGSPTPESRAMIEARKAKAAEQRAAKTEAERAEPLNTAPAKRTKSSISESA